MHRPVTFIGIAVAALVLGAAPAAHAANPQVHRFIDSGSFTDPDYCGTGQAVQVSFEVRVVEFLAPNQDVDVAQVAQGTFTLTNPETGATVQNHFAGPFVGRLSGDPAGLHTLEYTSPGLNEQLRLEHGRVLSLDAGFLTFRDTFDGEEFLSGEIVISHGPHPDTETDFALFCELTSTALGL